ncbi:DUF397 domain-containing protein [Streptomyces litchfieldiae]|uniref:DUF397 domain-containing protein n=1 Tax=Streptomyces litchfieldiae TaxID=3075543 RepID=A0ABU2MYL7_9ACTN|nr:DUF397 domain-containing protein [Streptomyces sp. DSM 44938]MDT0346751.1 DUF397 domain-containing protein [Streptomyces sp. DSM 44938]
MNRDDLDHAKWFTSSYSNGNGSCVEVAFVRSSYSANGGQCVEVAALGDAIAMRDSKDKTGPVLTTTVEEWRAFIAGVVNDRFGQV